MFYKEKLLPIVCFIFKGNTFIDISVLSQLMYLKLSNGIYDVAFDNNTFQNFGINSHFGGIGLEVDHESEMISILISFKNCSFINNNNKESEQKGSAIKKKIRIYDFDLFNFLYSLMKNKIDLFESDKNIVSFAYLLIQSVSSKKINSFLDELCKFLFF